MFAFLNICTAVFHGFLRSDLIQTYHIPFPFKNQNKLLLAKGVYLNKNLALQDFYLFLTIKRPLYFTFFLYFYLIFYIIIVNCKKTSRAFFHFLPFSSITTEKQPIFFHTFSTFSPIHFCIKKPLLIQIDLACSKISCAHSDHPLKVELLRPYPA